jgi:hypothetical protein
VRGPPGGSSAAGSSGKETGDGPTLTKVVLDPEGGPTTPPDGKNSSTKGKEVPPGANEEPGYVPLSST